MKLSEVVNNVANKLSSISKPISLALLSFGASSCGGGGENNPAPEPSKELNLTDTSSLTAPLSPKQWQVTTNGNAPVEGASVSIWEDLNLPPTFSMATDANGMVQYTPDATKTSYVALQASATNITTPIVSFEVLPYLLSAWADTNGFPVNIEAWEVINGFFLNESQGDITAHLYQQKEDGLTLVESISVNGYALSIEGDTYEPGDYIVVLEDSITGNLSQPIDIKKPDPNLAFGLTLDLGEDANTTFNKGNVPGSIGQEWLAGVDRTIGIRSANGSTLHSGGFLTLTPERDPLTQIDIAIAPNQSEVVVPGALTQAMEGNAILEVVITNNNGDTETASAELFIFNN